MVDGMTRCGFLAQALGTAWLGASFLERASLRAAQARAQSKRRCQRCSISKSWGDGVCGAVARGRTILNSNATIFENANDLLVVDSQAAPSAIYALLAADPAGGDAEAGPLCSADPSAWRPHAGGCRRTGINRHRSVCDADRLEGADRQAVRRDCGERGRASAERGGTRRTTAPTA